MSDGAWMGADEGEAAYMEAQAEQAFAEDQAQQALEAEAAYAEYMASQPARPGDDALDRLESALPLAHLGGDPTQQAWVLDKREALATVRSALQQLREERDELERDRDSWVDQFEESRRLAAKDVARAEAAEAVLVRYREGLREFAEIGPDSDLYLIDVRDKARALLAASSPGLVHQSRPPGDTEGGQT